MWSQLEDRKLTVDEDSNVAARRIADTFNDYFSTWAIHVPPSEIRPGARDSFAQDGWGINYVVDTDDNGDLYLEFYATHRMTDDRHVLISSSGEMTHLDAITGMYMYDPKVAGDRERASRRNTERNRRVAEELERKGLYPAADINAFLRTGGMEAEDTLKEMAELLEKAGLPMPPIPDELQSGIYPVRRWCYATRDIDPLDMYAFHPYLIEAITAQPEPYFAFSHAGHGMNSYAINYHVVIKGLALFVQVPWGGVYIKGERQAAIIEALFKRCAELLQVVSDGAKGQLFVATSELRGHRLSGRLPPDLEEEEARVWLRSEELKAQDPFERAIALLKEAGAW